MSSYLSKNTKSPSTYIEKFHFANSRIQNVHFSNIFYYADGHYCCFQQTVQHLEKTSKLKPNKYHRRSGRNAINYLKEPTQTARTMIPRKTHYSAVNSVTWKCMKLRQQRQWKKQWTHHSRPKKNKINKNLHIIICYRRQL